MMAGASSPMSFSYSGADPAAIQTRLSQIQQSGFDTQPNAGEIFSLTTGMDMIGFSNQSDVVSWQNQNQNDDPSLRCVFPCGANERPSQGLSLSLSSTDPSGIGLQSFELRPTHHQHQHQHQNDDDHMRFLTRNNGFFFGKPPPQEQMMNIGEGLLGKQVNFTLRNSTYLSPAKELLNEFCSLETTSHQADQAKKQHRKNKETEVDNSGTGSTSNQSSSSPSSLYALDIIELQKRKAKLLSMLEEVDRRYRHYCDQMKAVVSSFEAAAGTGAARVYSALAAKAMSRHFRSLRDGIVSQIQATKKAMGEKDPATPGASRGETPRLRLLDQTLRQQRAFQQMAVMESHPWRPQRGLPERSVSVLRAWLFEHFLHPYPSDVDKHILARQTGLSRSQVSNWFINARVRLWKPMVEEMYVEETKEQDNLNNNMGCSSETGPSRPDRNEDHKPTADQLVRIDSECLSSIITNPDKEQQHHYGTTSYGAMELDFASYNPNNTVSFQDNNLNFNGGVSLTLGLQQHGNNGGGGGVSLAFTSPSTAGSQGSMFYPRDHHHQHQHHDHDQDQHEMEPVVQYTMMDGEAQNNNLPYRNLMGAQLLHDLAG